MNECITQNDDICLSAKLTGGLESEQTAKLFQFEQVCHYVSKSRQQEGNTVLKSGNK